MSRWILPLTLGLVLGCTGMLGEDAPMGDTADPGATGGGEAVDAVPEEADPAPDDDGAADAEDDSEGEPGAEPAGDDEGDAPANEDGSDEATEGDDKGGPQGRRPRRRKRPQGRRGGAGAGGGGGGAGGGAKPAPAPEPAPEGAEEKPEPTPAPEPAPKSSPSPKPKGITQISDTHWEVSQANFDRWKGDPYALGGGISQKGEGWEVRWVRKREAFHLGMKNKDVVLQVNGKKLKTKAQLAAAYLTLKNKDEFDVLFERKGQQMTHHYTVK